MKQTEIVKKAFERLQQWNGGKHILAGFDGFVDEIIHVVDKRTSPSKYQRIMDIKAFSERIASVAGLSANIELVPIQTKLGGNGPITANALMLLNHEISYIGALGKYFIHPVFREFADRCKNVISLTDPGYTDALEFLDGKIMMGKMNRLVEVNYETLLEKKSEEDIAKLLEKVRLLTFSNWTMLGGMDSIMKNFGRLMEKQAYKPRIFIDLADPKKRTMEDIRKVLKTISGLPGETVLSMNLSESTLISLALGIKEEEILSRATQIRDRLGITGIVIHPVNGAAVTMNGESVWIEGPYTSKPRLTTGAGDNFNAGFCDAWLGGFVPGECLVLGVCTSGFYVRNGKSPSRPELLKFLKKWMDVDCGPV